MPDTLPYYGSLPLSRSLMKGAPYNPALFSLIPPSDVVAGINVTNIAGQTAANAARVPNAPALEQQSSSDIAALLNPPAFFADTDRMSAEAGAGRGISGSGAAESTAVRMTDEERLRRMALGQSFLSAADYRNPGAPLANPLQVIGMQQAAYQNLFRPTGPSARISASSGPTPGQSPQSYSGYSAPYYGGLPQDPYGTGYSTDSNYLVTTPGASLPGGYAGGSNYPNPSAPLLPLYPGQQSGQSQLDATLRDLGLVSPDYNPGQVGGGYTPIGDLPGTGE